MTPAQPVGARLLCAGIKPPPLWPQPAQPTELFMLPSSKSKLLCHDIHHLHIKTNSAEYFSILLYFTKREQILNQTLLGRSIHFKWISQCEREKNCFYYHFLFRIRNVSCISNVTTSCLEVKLKIVLPWWIKIVEVSKLWVKAYW